MIISVGFLSMVFVVIIFSEGNEKDVGLVLFLSICSMVPLFTPKKIYRSRDGIIKVEEVNFPLYSKIFIILEKYFPPFKTMRIFNEKILTKSLPATGVPFDVERMATISTRATILSIPVISAVALFLVTTDMIFLAVLAIPALVYFQPFIKMRLIIAERKTRIEEEMAYFLCYCNIMESVGTGLYMSFRAIMGRSVFPGMERDVPEIVKRVEMIGISRSESLSKYGQNHPSKMFGDFINGYIAKIKSVGNVPAYTESKAKYFFEEFLASWDRYEKSAQEIFSAVLMIAVILPMMMAFNAIIGAGGAMANLMVLIGIMVSPMVSILMVIMLNSSQPATGTSLPLSYPSLAAGAGVGITMFAMGFDAPTSMAIACFAGGLLNYIFTAKKFRDARTVDNMMPEFMRDVTEISKTGQNINQIIQAQAGKNSYKKQFNNILSDMAIKLNRGMSFDEVSTDIKSESVYVRFIFFLLGRTYATGGGSADVFHTITEFISKINQKRKNITKGLSSLVFIVYFSPFIMLGVAHIMLSMFSGIEIPEGAPSGGFTFQAPDESLADSISLMAVTTSVPMAVVGSKIANFTVKHTLPVAIVSITTLIAIHTIPFMIDTLGIFK